MPPHVSKAIAEVLGYRNRPNPIDIYDAIREALGARPPAVNGIADAP